MMKMQCKPIICFEFSVYDSLNLTHRRVLDDIVVFFSSVLPRGKSWRLSIPTNLAIQDDISSCGAHLMFFSYALATTGMVPAGLPAAKKIRNFILKKLRGGCKITSVSEKSKCTVCKKMVKDNSVSCNKCKNVFHKSCRTDSSEPEAYICP